MLFDEQYGNYLPSDEVADQRFEVCVDSVSQTLNSMLENELQSFNLDEGVEVEYIARAVIEFNKKLTGTPKDEVIGVVIVREGDYHQGELYDYATHEFAVASWATTMEMIEEV